MFTQNDIPFFPPFSFIVENTVAFSSPTVSSPSTSSCSSASPLRSSSLLSPDWAESFEVPWHKLPEEMMQCLERKKRPSPRLRREMVRIVVSEMTKVCSTPGKQSTVAVAKKMVAGCH